MSGSRVSAAAAHEEGQAAGSDSESGSGLERRVPGVAGWRRGRTARTPGEIDSPETKTATKRAGTSELEFRTRVECEE